MTALASDSNGFVWLGTKNSVTQQNPNDWQIAWNFAAGDIGLDGSGMFFGATGLTGLTDNAALTYLGSLVEGISPKLQYALVAGAVTGASVLGAPFQYSMLNLASIRGGFRFLSGRQAVAWERLTRVAHDPLITRDDREAAA